MRRLGPILVNRICFEQVSVCCLLDIEQKRMFLSNIEFKTMKSEIHCLPLDSFLSFETNREQHLRSVCM